ncbi:MAG TPA: 4a-hydroxytetrahydrobiopterin dehydratase [Solirubrobacteraceae bacterium]
MDGGATRPKHSSTAVHDPDRSLARHQALDRDDLASALASQPAWRICDGALVRELLMRDFDEAMRLFDLVARGAVDYGRRPDMCISEFNHVRLSISNPHHAGLTLAEVRLAVKVSALLDGFGREGTSNT